MLLPVVLGSAGTLVDALIVQQKSWTFPTLGEINYTASFTNTIHKTLCPNDDAWKGRSKPQKQGEE
jgi:hypothetical protein